MLSTAIFKKPILVPEIPVTLTKLLLAMEYKHYSCDSKIMLQ